MDNSILYKEKQRFNQWWIWLIIIVVNSVFIYGVFQQIFNGKPFGDKPMSNVSLLIINITFFILSLLFITFNLETIIKADGIYIRFFPIHRKLKFLPWTSLSKVYLRTYSPLKEFGGSGFRYSLTGKGKAYNVSGNNGLQLEFENGKKLLIGTKNPEELLNVLKSLNKVKE